MTKYLTYTAAALLLTVTACSKVKIPDFPAANNNDTTPATELTLRNMPFPFGGAVNISLLKNNTSYRNVAIKEYSSLTAENAMKFGSLHPAENTWTWSDADYLVTFAQQNNQRIHGHTLIWYKSLPNWVTNFTGDSAAWENLMKTHIQTVVTHFKGKVASWDVVNEAFEDDGTLRNSVWKQHLGNDYIARCFQYAHEADPNAVLIYNDYGHEYSSARRTAIYGLANSLVSRGIPINGLGLQMHTRYNQTTSNLAAAINGAAATGLKVHIAELDIVVNPDSKTTITFTPALAELQAQQYKFIVQTYNAIPKAQQFGITTWNVGDADSWIRSTYSRSDWPLPFDDYYQRKPAYHAILAAVK